jgi:ribosomal protein L11 methyltransferase
MLDHQFDEKELQELIGRYEGQGLTYTIEKIATRNWNEDWEKNYEPIVVDDKCVVRATFHEPQPNFPFEIVINPRMSFGTGHHATTFLMLQQQMELDHTGKRVLDAGCGTAILAVMAEKLGAAEVVAYDNNSWTIENAPENLSLNMCTKVQMLEGTISSLNLQGKFDIILANINKNVLLEEMASYESYLNDRGVLILSGFYSQDEKELVNSAESLGLVLSKSLRRNDWSTLRFEKK